MAISWQYIGPHQLVFGELYGGFVNNVLAEVKRDVKSGRWIWSVRDPYPYTGSEPTREYAIRAAAQTMNRVKQSQEEVICPR